MASPVLQLRGFSYDSVEQTLRDASGKECNLRPQSLAVLHLLASQPNKVITKDEIFHAVWPDVSVTDDSLVQCVADIRRVLGDKQHKILQTVPRRGYKLIAEDTAKTPVSFFQPFNTPAFLGGVFAVIIAMVFAITLWPSVDEASGLQSKAPTLSINVSSASELTQQERQVSDKTRIALSRYRTIHLLDGDADFSATLKPQISDGKTLQNFDLELRDSGSDTIFFGESFQLKTDEAAIEKLAARIAASIASPGGGAVGRRLLAQSKQKPVEELSDHECYAHGYGCPTCSGEEETITPRAKACLANILQRNPEDAKAWALQSTIITRQNWFGVALSEAQKNDPDLVKTLQAEAIAAATKAESFDAGDDSAVYWGMAQAYVASCEPDKLKAAVARGLEINPYDPNLLAAFGNWLAYTGAWDEGRTMIKQALELEPRNYKKWWWYGIAKYHYNRAEYDQSLAAFLKSYNERNWLSHLHLAYTYPHLNRTEDARQETKKVLEMFPGFNRSFARKFYVKFCFQESYIDKMEQGLVASGMPDVVGDTGQSTQPTIAIQQFKNLTDSQRWGRLAEALSSDIANELARNQWLFVTAPAAQPEKTSSGSQLTSTGSESNGQYILSGSVQAENDDLRISVRLSDASTGKIIWSERWDRPAQAIFAIQDEILQKVESTMSGAWSGVVAKEGRIQARHKPTSNLDAYELFLLGTEHKHKFTSEHDEIAASYFNKAVEIDPGYSKAWATLAVLRANQSVNALEKEKRSYFAEGRQAAAIKAYAASPTDPDALIQISWLKGKQGDFETAENSLRQAVAFSPNNPDILAHTAWVGAIRSPVLKQDALAWGRKAVGSSAVYPAWYRAGLGIAAFYAADYQLALGQLKNAPDMADVLIHRAAAAALLGDTKETASAVERFNEVVPAGFTVFEYIELNGFHQSSRSQLLKGARLAGLPIGEE